MTTNTLDPISEYITGHDYRMLIGGDLVEARDGATMDTVNPNTGEHLTTVPLAGAADIHRAYEAAAAAQPAWEAIGIDGRAEVFGRFAAAIEAERDRFAMLDALDAGLPRRAMYVDVAISLANIRDWPALVRWHGGRTIPASRGNLHYTSYRPYGVVGKILAYNHPMMFATTRVLCALIAGNAVIIKPAPQVPLSALVLGEIAREVFPPGVFNVVTGGADAGQAIVTHPNIRRVGFTGSVATGLKIQQAAASVGVKHLSLELGGKNPMIVFPDADIDRAIQGAVDGMNFGICAGQSCGSNSRTYVHRDVYEDFLVGVAEKLEAMNVGPAPEDGSDMGPVVSREHYERVTGFISKGREQGARLITGGDRPNGSTPDGGYFVRPTLFADVTMQMDIGRREIFGPVMSMAPWDDIDEVIATANDTDYGLTAGVWTNDLHAAHRVAERLEAGYVWINDSARHYWGTPFGGVKDSGIGREESTEEYESYLQQKVIHTILRDPRL